MDIIELIDDLNQRKEFIAEKFLSLELKNYSLKIDLGYENGLHKRILKVFHARKGTLIDILVLTEKRDGLENLYVNRKEKVLSLLWVRNLRRLKNQK